MKRAGTQPIETQRLLLRRFAQSDAEEVYQNWASDAEVTRYMLWLPHKDMNETRAILRAWEESYAKEGYYHWAIVRKTDGVLMGSLGILWHDGGADGAGRKGYEPGYCLGRAFWGQGYASEALCAALAYFVADTGVDTLQCCHAVANPASGRVMEKAGFCFVRMGSYTGPDGAEVPAKFYLYHHKERQ
ncbi:GNAT family N-acetyltransferase [Ruminococcaceae bacterium OttesenSCG-928-O06]|nr:GNAT family N-acetyltransferase [Ruminococcaceae bacterium OttesenSCG-928-O06]